MISASLIWEAFKSYIRGQIIAFSGSQDKQRREQESQLFTLITKLEYDYASSPSDLYKKLLIFRSEFDTSATEQAESKL